MKNSLANTIRRMKLFEFIPITTLTTSKGITTEENCINYYFPEDEKVMRLFEPVLGKYGTSPVFFFKGPPPVPWALVCFDKDMLVWYSINTSRVNFTRNRKYALIREAKTLGLIFVHKYPLHVLLNSHDGGVIIHHVSLFLGNRCRSR